MNEKLTEAARKLRKQFRDETGAESNCGPEDFDNYIYWLEAKVLQQQAQPEVSGAFELLRDLADLQNGPPLEQHRKEWEETMELVYAALNKWEAK